MTVSGSSTLVRATHSEKAFVSIRTKPYGKVIVFSDRQLSNP